ncbi:MAG: hypothetical protein COA88_02355 [Kordia sp.]|nr:MAG: hypothetical protein COA88_02355 [Kordia sp.]
MKQNLKNYFKLGILLFGISVAITSCQKDDDQVVKNQENFGMNYEVTSLEDLPNLIPVVDNVKRVMPKTSGTTSRSGVDFIGLENVNVDKVIKITNESGKSTYTFKIDNPNSTGNNFENLHLVELEGGYLAYILSYEPNQEWYNSTYTPEGDWVFDMKTYEGDVTKYNLQRDVIWTTIPDESSRMAYVTICTYSYGPVCDHGGSLHPWGGNCGGNLSHAMIETCYTFNTGGGGGSTTGSDTDPGDPTGDNTGGSGGSSNVIPPCIPGADGTNTQSLSGSFISNEGEVAEETTSECVEINVTGVLPPAIEKFERGLSPEQRAWWDLDVNGVQVAAIINYQILKGHTLLSREFSKEVIVALMNEVNVTYTETDYPGKDLGYSYQWWLDEEFVEANFSFELDDQNFGNLTTEEKLLVIALPVKALIIKANKQPAEVETVARFGVNGRNDKSDAFRHAFFNAMNANDAGMMIANLFSDAHESENPPNLIKEEQMDLFNNNVGLNIGSNASIFVADSVMSDTVYQDLLNGLLVYLSPLGPVVPPNFGITTATQLTPTNN